MVAEVVLHLKKRHEILLVPQGMTVVKFTPSRTNCADVLVEMVTSAGHAKGNPLHKFRKPFNMGNEVKQIRFTMNNFSSAPISIKMEFN